MKPVRIAVLTCLWKRHALSGRVLARFSAAKKALAETLHLELVAVGSEIASRKIAKAHGWTYVAHRNRPLGAKWNRGLREVKKLDVDAVLIVGSDDMISDGLLLRYAALLRKGVQYAGTRDVYFMCGKTLRCVYFAGYPRGPRYGEPVGAGRMIKTSVLEVVRWRLWNSRANKSLDASMSTILKRAGVRPHVFRMASVPRGSLVDIKTSENIWGFKRLEISSKAVGIDRVLGPMGRQEVRALMVSLGRTPRGRARNISAKHRGKRATHDPRKIVKRIRGW